MDKYMYSRKRAVFVLVVIAVLVILTGTEDDLRLREYKLADLGGVK